MKLNWKILNFIRSKYGLTKKRMSLKLDQWLLLDTVYSDSQIDVHSLRAWQILWFAWRTLWNDNRQIYETVYRSSSKSNFRSRDEAARIPSAGHRKDCGKAKAKSWRKLNFRPSVLSVQTWVYQDNLRVISESPWMIFILFRRFGILRRWGIRIEIGSHLMW